MSLPSVVWSNCREMGMIGGMKQGSFQSRLVHCSFYFAQELVSLSRPCIHGSLATRNYLLPSIGRAKPVGVDDLLIFEGLGVSGAKRLGFWLHLLFLFKIRSSVYESYVYLTTFVYMLLAGCT